MMDTPAIGSSTYGASSSVFALNAAGPIQQLGVANNAFNARAEDQNFRRMVEEAQRRVQPKLQQQQQEIFQMSAMRRLVKVVIIDPDENVPLSDCVLFSGEEKLTDATDQELFFEIDIKRILDEHNAKRIKLIDKKVKERTENLEPAKIRDLNMVVVNVATF